MVMFIAVMIMKMFCSFSCPPNLLVNKPTKTYLLIYLYLMDFATTYRKLERRKVIVREARLNKIAEEDKQRKCLGHMNSSAHMKLAIECCVPKKRKYVDVVRSSFYALPKILNVPSIEQLANQKNVLSPLMIEKCKSVKPWIEDLSCPFKRIDKNFLSHELQMRISFEEKIYVVLKEMGVFKKKNIDPAKYKISFKVFIPINEPLHHWSLAMFHICSGVVTFCDNERTKGGKYPDGVTKQGGVFGDCGVYLCMFLYRLANSIPLALNDPLHSALAYQEKLIHFYFKHKMFCP
nr:hypothetical protein [Tanacetum cinerariifolium]